MAKKPTNNNLRCHSDITELVDKAHPVHIARTGKYINKVAFVDALLIEGLKKLKLIKGGR